MPRMLRFESPGSLVHIMARGIDGRPIFDDDKDRHEFLSRFARHRAACGYKCLAWCLMPNHYHLLLRTTEQPMSSLMRPLNGGYARWFNDRHDRRGYLFQDRYRSILCQDMSYAIELVRYIHLNPIRAGLVSTLAQLRSWKWCGHARLLGTTGALGEAFQDRAEPLRRFGSKPVEAVTAYQQFLSDGIDKSDLSRAGELQQTDATEVSGSEKGWPAVIGDPEFARAAMQQHEVNRLRKHRKADYAPVLETLADKICTELKLTREDLLKKGRSNDRTLARSRFCYRAHFEHAIPYAVIARFLGTTIAPTVFLAKRQDAASAR